MAQPIPIVSDVPCTDPGLGFKEYAEAIADSIRGGEPPQFTIGLYGAWGSGKSSLLNAIARKLSEEGSEVIPVLFDAWRYEKMEHIVVPLLHCIYTAVRKSGNTKVSSYLERALRSIVFSLNFKLGVLEVDTKEVKKSWNDQGLIPLDNAFCKPFEELRKLPDVLKGKRIAVLIDDLDRCSPVSVVSVLESINLVMDVPGFIFVLALDFEVLIKAVSEKYPHVAGEVFIQKMIQVPFRVPPLDVDNPDFLSELIPDLPKLASSIPDGFSSYVREISDVGLKANPRQIKRLINSFLLLKRIMGQRDLAVDDQLLAALIGLQLRWPANYQDFQESVLADDPDPHKSLANAEDEPELQKYSSRFFGKKINTKQLKQLFQYTAVVAGQETEPEILGLSESRQIRVKEFLSEIIAKGYQVSPRSSRLYYHPQNKRSRIGIGKTVIRIEKKRGKRWVLDRSFLITSETSDALKVAESLAQGEVKLTSGRKVPFKDVFPEFPKFPT